MTDLTKTVKRRTSARLFERSVHRKVIVELAPPCRVGFRLEGTRRTYYLDADTLYHLALNAHLQAQRTEKKKAAKRRRRAA